MTPVDILFVHPGDRRQVYQDLGDEFCAVEPPAVAGCFATYVRRQGGRAAILDAPALGLSAARWRRSCHARLRADAGRNRRLRLAAVGLDPEHDRRRSDRAATSRA